jgi:hypothetical protein
MSHHSSRLVCIFSTETLMLHVDVVPSVDEVTKVYSQATVLQR